MGGRYGGEMSDFSLPHASQDLSGQVALVTGASSGLGWRFAQTLASVGATVVAAGRRIDRLEELCRGIEGRGGSAHPVRMDTSDPASIMEGIEQASSAAGLVTIAVNNAGIPDAQRAHKMSIDLIDSVIDTNLKGPYVLACEVARRLIAAESPGRIINISSIAAFDYGGNGAALYSITKAAIARMSEVLAVEWSAHNINVNCIAPGAFRSEMMDGMISRIGDVTRRFPRGRLGEPAQLDSTLLYLCSPASECVTGAIIKVDDGQGAR